MADRDFKGIWIPKEIYLNKELNWTEKILFIEIDSLDNDNGCFASNKYFAEFIGVSQTRISKSISHLKELGLIYQDGFNGRERILHTNIKMAKQTCRKVQGRFKQNDKHNNIVNNASIKNMAKKHRPTKKQLEAASDLAKIEANRKDNSACL